MDERDRRALEAIAEHAHRASRYADEGGETWYLDDRTVDAVALRVEQLGEAAKQVSEKVRARHRGLPWAHMTRLRDLIAHHYGRIDPERLRDTIEGDLPGLIEGVEAILRETRSAG